jgi:L-iditol 2-dehydrogenase
MNELANDRLTQAVRLGADRVVDISRENLGTVVSEQCQGDGVNVVIVAAPAPQAQECALQLAAIGGRINFFWGLRNDRPTIAFDSNQAYYKELIMTGTITYSHWTVGRQWELSTLVKSTFHP